jgi:hypothetical protein
MDIQMYNDIYSGLKTYVADKGNPYGVSVVNDVTTDTKYPFIFIEENSNNGFQGFNGRFDKVSNITYRIEVFAKDKNKTSKQQIARELAQLADTFMTEVVGLTVISRNANTPTMDGALYRYTSMYNGYLHENRKRFF